jgi:hypothetical protein
MERSNYLSTYNDTDIPVSEDDESLYDSLERMEKIAKCKKKCIDCKFFVKLKRNGNRAPKSDFCNKKRKWLFNQSPCDNYLDREEYFNQELKMLEELGFKKVCDEDDEDAENQITTWDQV